MAGRPREFDREAALLRARNLFWQRGYEGVSMSDLVAALGIASARIYAAFGSKEQLFREAVAFYEAKEGGFADRALAEETSVWTAIERILREAIELYTSSSGSFGCMVVSAAVNYSAENKPVEAWLAAHRRARTDSIINRIKTAIAEGELPKSADAQRLGDLCAALLHGFSVQARDGISRERLLATIPIFMRSLKERD